MATVRGEHAYDDQLRRFDGEWLDGIASRFRAIADEANRVDTATLSTQDRISFGLLAHESDGVGNRDRMSSSGTRVPVWLRYLCSTPGWGLGGVDAVWPATRVGEGSVFS